jgi:hypothetical protein
MRLPLNRPFALIVLIITLLVAGCGITTSRDKVSAVRPASPIATPSLAWQKRSLPDSNAAWTISPIDGQHEWACAPIPGTFSGFTVWESQDGAVTWSKVGGFSPKTPEAPTSCGLNADQRSLSTLVAEVSWGAGADNTLRSLSLISTDSGATWRQLPGDVAISNESTIGDKIFAILDDTAHNMSEGTIQLVVSADGMRTWRLLRPALLSSSDGFFNFQIGPTPNEIIGETYRNTLWRSTDSGANWTRIPTPDQQTDLALWLAQSNRWMFCGWAGGALLATACSTDLGKTWPQKPMLNATLSCANCGKGGTPYTTTQSCFPSAITSDGALVAFCIDSTVHLLAPNAQQWATLGTAPLPGPALLVGNQLWCFDPQEKLFWMATLPA